jgi:hypothetical protein
MTRNEKCRKENVNSNLNSNKIGAADSLMKLE